METERRQRKREKKRAEASKLCVLSLAFFLVLTVYNGIEIVQQDLYPKLGTAAAGTVLGTAILASIFLAVPILNLIGVKWGIFLLCVSHVLYTAVNFYPTWGAIIPFSVVLGIGSAIGWAGLGVYMAALANKFSILAQRERNRVLSLFWGVFFWYNGLARPLGYYISKDIVRDYKEISVESPQSLTMENASTSGPLEEEYPDYPEFINVSMYEPVCGAGYCPNMDTEEQLRLQPNEVHLYVLMAVYLVASISGSVASVTLPSLDPDQEGRKRKVPPIQTFREMLKLCKDYRPLLLVFPYLTTGVVRAMHIWSYNKAFVLCSLGSGVSGYALLYDGLGYSFTALLSGYLVKYIPRVYHVTGAAILNIALAITWLSWQPDGAGPSMFFILATLQGCTNGVWRVHTMSITGALFPDSLAAGYAHLMVWDSLGHIIVFGYNSFLCFYAITALFICLVVAALSSYLVLELVFVHEVISCKRPSHKKLDEESALGDFESSVDDFEFSDNNNRWGGAIDEAKALMHGVELRTTVTFEDC